MPDPRRNPQGSVMIPPDRITTTPDTSYLAELYEPGSNKYCAASVADINVLKKATVTRTDAQIKTLPTIPVQVAPAPGSGKANILSLAVIHVNFTAGAYNLVLADPWPFWKVQSPGESAESAYFDIGTALISAQNTILKALPAQKMGGSGWTLPNVNNLFSGNCDASYLDNAPLQLFAFDWNDDAVNYQGGHASNRAKITTFYQIVDLL